jgi:D-threo-aldose 1-dehydrogenase
MRVHERRALGRTSLRVSRLGLGTAPLGGLFEAVGDEEAEAVVSRTLELGIDFIDTAPLYGFGVAEERLGRALADVPRDSFTLATKVGRLLEPDAPVDPALVHDGKPYFEDTPPVNPVFDFSRDAILRSIEESLERLGVERLDVVHIHDPDDHFEQALSEAYPTLDRLRSEGLIGAVGAGMTQSAMLARLAREADFDCFLLAGRYSLLDQEALSELLPLCAERSISLIVGGVYNSGILANPDPRATFDYVPAAPALIERARRMEAVCARHDVPLKAAAIQFPFGHPAVANVLTGTRSVAELEENVRMFETPIPADLWDELRAEGLLAPEVPTP